MLLCAMDVIFSRGYANPWLKFVSGVEKHLRSCAQPLCPSSLTQEPDGLGGPRPGGSLERGGRTCGEVDVGLLMVLVLLKALAELCTWQHRHTLGSWGTCCLLGKGIYGLI